MQSSLESALATYLDANGVSRASVHAHLSRAAERATELDRASGARWYADAYRIAATMALEFEFTLRQATGVISALSPQADWERNVANARKLLELLATNSNLTIEAARQGIAVQPTRNLAMGIAVARSASDPLEIITGPKRRAFYVNILDPSDARTVTIDSHMVAIMTGCSTPEAQRIVHGPRSKRFGGRGSYDWFAAQIIEAARDHQMVPCEFQATLWLARARAAGFYKSATSANGKVAATVAA